MTVPLVVYPASNRDTKFVPGSGLPDIVSTGTRIDDQSVYNQVTALAAAYGFPLRSVDPNAVPPVIPSSPKYVRYDGAQGLSDTEKAQARANIGAGTGPGSGSSDWSTISNKPAFIAAGSTAAAARTAIGAGAQFTATAVKTAAYTAAPSELVRVDISGGSFAVTLPPATSKWDVIIKVVAVVPTAFGSTSCSVQPQGTDTINGAATAVPFRYMNQSKRFTSNGDGNIVVSGGDWDKTVLDQLYGSTGRRFNLRDYGAKTDGIRILDAATTSAQPTVTSTARPFTSADVGKTIGVAMPIGTFPDAWISTIQSVSGGVATLATNAPATVSNAECSFGTPDDTALAAALAAAVAAGGGTIVVPDGRTILTANILWANNVDFIGRSRETSILTWIRNGLSGIQAPNGYSTTNNQPLTGCRFASHKVEARLHTYTSYSSSCKPLNIFNVRRVAVTDMWMENTPATAIPCDQSTEQCTIAYNLVTNPGRMNDGTQPGGSGIGMGTAADASNLEPTYVVGNVIIGDGTRGQNGIFVENTLTNDTSHYTSASMGYRIEGNAVAFMKYGITDAGSQATVVQGNYVTKCRVAAICVGPGTYNKGMPGRHFLIDGNTCTRNGIGTPTNDTGYGILIDLTAYFDTTAAIPANALGQGKISDNNVTLNTGSGIVVALGSASLDCQDLVVQGNYVAQNLLSGLLVTYRPATAATASTKALRNAHIDGNTFTNNNLNNGANSLSATHSAMRFEANIVDCEITDNSAYDNQTTKTQAYGLFLSTAVTFTGGSFRRNKLRNNKTDSVSILTAPGWSATTLVADNDGYVYDTTSYDTTWDSAAHPILSRVRITGTSSSSHQNISQVDYQGVPTIWQNERGLWRGRLQDNLDAIFRVLLKDSVIAANPNGFQSVAFAVMEILNEARTKQPWGVKWDGQPIHSGIFTNVVLYWKTGDPSPLTDTTGKFGYGQYAQEIPSYMQVVLTLGASDTVPAWAPTDGRTTIRRPA